MENKVFKIITLTLFSSTILLGSGWRIPEQSASAVALSGAYIANANGADSSYYNSANMSFNENKNQLDASLTYIHTSSIQYKDNRNPYYDSNSLEENIFIPTFFLSSKNYNGLRYGVSITVPAGLSKRWDDPFAKTFSQDFTLKIIEFNPTISFLIYDNFSIAGGLRGIYSEGLTKSDGYADANHDGTVDTKITRDMPGDTTAFGYNLALAYKPTSNSNLSLTYRSNVNIKEEGTADISASDTVIGGTTAIAGETIHCDASVEIPLPAVLSIATSFKFNNTTLELEYDKTYWSKYKALDFEYSQTITNPVLKAALDDPKAKNWKDTNAYRIGLTHQFTSKVVGMIGYAQDENPAPENSLSFELPDSDAKIYSCGLNYKLDTNSSLGFGYLYDKKESRDVKNTYLDGTFSNNAASLITISYQKSF